jgi:hypothetical protein
MEHCLHEFSGPRGTAHRATKVAAASYRTDSRYRKCHAARYRRQSPATYIPLRLVPGCEEDVEQTYLAK